MKSQYIYGLHAIKSAISNKAASILTLFYSEARHDKRLQALLDVAKQQNIATKRCDKNELTHMAQTSKHQGVVALCEYQEQATVTDLSELFASLTEPPFLLILDGITDPHNLGACMRSANAAGVHAVIAPKDKAASVTPLVRKIASGAVDETPFIQVTNLARTLRDLKEQGVWIYGLSDKASESLYQIDLTGPLALVMGAEGAGLRRLTQEHCDAVLSIPMAGDVSSLNVSVATGVCLFEAVRQRKL